MIENINDDISITIAGEAGQGIDTITSLITKVLKQSEYNVCSCKEFMSRIRGGTNSSQIRISSRPVAAYVKKIDFLFALSHNSIQHLEQNISNKTVILYDDILENLELKEYNNIGIPITPSALEIGAKIFSNTVLAGVIFGMFLLDENLIKESINKGFQDKSQDVIDKNIRAVEAGYKIGQNIISDLKISITIKKDNSLKDQILLNGSDAVSLGCIAGGCDFISSYPMSPSTGVLTYLSQESDKFNIIVEQAEDEISAMNMGIGAWSVGSRAMVTTSGGGFDLMTEALSLAGMIESPMVIHLAQRPGPATSMPTRTAQEDLNLALYSGHSEFPRIILAPGTNEEAFEMSRNAFNLADKYQVPVFILTDQYFLDTLSLSPFFNLNNFEVEDFITKTDKYYKRYQFTENGISPRGIALYGDGFVKLCSDEHDEDGNSTEDFNTRIQMVDKRLKKLDAINSEIYAPKKQGLDNYKILLIGWGSTYSAINEALKVINNNEIAFLHFKQVYPITQEVKTYLEQARKIICIENNATGQFANLIKQIFGLDNVESILKYNGLPFSVEELVCKINEIERE